MIKNNKTGHAAVTKKQLSYPSFFSKRENIVRRKNLLLALLLATYTAFSQTIDSTKNIRYFSGAASITNNGISIVPSFSLGKPAVIFNLSTSKGRFSFDPDLRFSLTGKPWTMLFWGRYKLVARNKFKMHAGMHLGLNYRRSVLPINGDTNEVNIVRRYLAGELFPRYLLTKNISIGIYYLYSHGLDAGTINNSNFVTLNTNVSNIKISKQFFINFNPQVYFLKLDQQEGFYFTSSLTVARKKFPVSISAIINKAIRSDIVGKDLLWNVSLVYTFHKNYYEAR